jgi:catechol 2,3-dioxygenase-like lactoylglutathione lyase family enzyme
MVRIGSVVLNVRDVSRASTFWSAALGYVPGDENPAMLTPENGNGPLLLLDEDDRTHVDLWAANAHEQRTRSSGSSRSAPNGWTGSIPMTPTSSCLPTPKATCSASSTPVADVARGHDERHPQREPHHQRR